MAAPQTGHIPDLSPVDLHSDYEDSQEDSAFLNRRSRGCCFWFPCFGAPQSATLWERTGTTPAREKEVGASWSWGWWDKGFSALNKVKAWSEVVAGPRWKTFIRRFNKGRGGGAGAVKFQYDPSSYALNFDEGPGQNGYFLEDDDRLFRDFSSRYASIPLTAKSFVEAGKDGNVYHSRTVTVAA